MKDEKKIVQEQAWTGDAVHSLFDLGKVRTLANLPRDVQDAVSSGNPIRELV